MIHTHPIWQCIYCWSLHRAQITLLYIRKSCTVKFMYAPFIWRQNLETIYIHRIVFFWYFVINLSLKKLCIWLMLPLSQNFKRIYRKGLHSILTFHHHIIPWPFNKSTALHSVNRMPTQMPRCNIDKRIAIIILFRLFRVCELIDVIPEGIFASRYRMPPIFQSWSILHQIFLIVLKLKSKIEGQKSLLLIRVMDSADDVSRNFKIGIIDFTIESKNIIVWAHILVIG